MILTLMKCDNCDNGFIIPASVVLPQKCPICKDKIMQIKACMQDIILAKIKTKRTVLTDALDRVVEEAELIYDFFKNIKE